MEKKLFEVYKDYFRVGAAVGGLFYDKKPPKGPFVDSEILAKHFNLVVAENDTKMCNMMPAPGTYNFSSADKFIEMAKKNGQDIRWHTLVWHNQAPEWIFKDENGNKASKELLLQRLKDYIFTIGKRYSKQGLRIINTFKMYCI